MKLRQLLTGVTYTFLDSRGNEIVGSDAYETYLEQDVTDITNDSRKAVQGGLFFCIPGAVRDGHDFALQVCEKGARVLIVEHSVLLSEQYEAEQAPILVKVESARNAMALIAANWYDHPATKMKMIGITGTKGKTTTTYLVKSILEHAGIDVGLIGTIESTWHDNHLVSGNTTPESLALQGILAKMAADGVQAVVMEVSSQALMMDRTAGIMYDLGVFTNISPDHIGPNEHDSFEDYMYCKGLLFRQCKVGIVNGDDPHAFDVLHGHTCSVQTYGLGTTNDLYAENLQLIKKPGELGISFTSHGLMELEAEVPTPGKFSVYNALCAIAICSHFGVSSKETQSALLQAKVRGRIEMVKVSDDFTLMIDYAHNAVALESLLKALRVYEPERLVTVFGCGGNRSKLRRYEMGEVSGNLSDLTIITSDNPRFEEPMDIIADIETGIRKTSGAYVTVSDRKDAIAYAIHNGKPGDIIVLAGKGHEDYQEIKGVKYPMDERDLIRDILEEDAAKKAANNN